MVATNRQLDPESTVATYRYDGLNRRVSKTVGSDTTHYYYNTNWQVLCEYVNDTYQLSYVWGLDYIDSPIQRVEAGGTILQYLFDANRHITSLHDATNGGIVERYQYDPYGKVTVLHGSTDQDGAVTEWEKDNGGSDFGNEILFTGMRYDPETGLYHVRNRYWHFGLGIWTQEDKSGYVDGMNLYAGYFVMAGAMDPFGLWTEAECKEFFSGSYFDAVAEEYRTNYNAIKEAEKLKSTLEKERRYALGWYKKLQEQKRNGIDGHYVYLGWGWYKWYSIESQLDDQIDLFYEINDAYVESKELIKENKKAYEASREVYLFFRFMQKHGCTCRPFYIRHKDAWKKINWGGGLDESSSARWLLNKATDQLIKRGGKLAGRSIPFGDLTKARKGFENARKFIESNLRPRQVILDIKQVWSDKVADISVNYEESWTEIVDESGEFLPKQ